MKSLWSDQVAAGLVSQYQEVWGEELALRTYSARLIGADPSLVLHGGGNTSVKIRVKDIFGEPREAIFVKASGYDLASIEPDGHSGLELAALQRLESLPELSDEEMVRQVRARLLDYRSANPSIEALAHAFIPETFLDHSHADAILALGNRVDGRSMVEEALGSKYLVLDYVEPGFELAKATAEAYRRTPDSRGIVWLRHGVVTWGRTARESYERMIEAVDRAERFLDSKSGASVSVTPTELDAAWDRFRRLAPVIRGRLARPTGNPDRPIRPAVLLPLIEESVLSAIGSEGFREAALTPAVTSDHLIRTKAYPLWIDSPAFEDPDRFRSQVNEQVSRYEDEYRAYAGKVALDSGVPLESFDPSPRVLLVPGMGAVCAGPNLREAQICRDITRQSIQIKARIKATGGTYEGLEAKQLLDMEFRGLQLAKIKGDGSAMGSNVALVTGAAGAIGAGICERLLEEGCQVAATDISEERLEALVADLRCRFGDRVVGIRMDVTDPASVAEAFGEAAGTWGGVDFVIPNAGMAMVSSLAEMELERFRLLERVNTEGTLTVLAEAARFFPRQGIGGDIVLVSTKNVFAPGARFGAYSATKAAAHQLARIASLELASEGVRVNMVSPDAIFGEGQFKSGLWAEVGPDRMRARGLDENALQEYYRERNLLKIKVTARHVANAVVFFLLRETPTTGATIPIDGGLPDSTPR